MKIRILRTAEILFTISAGILVLIITAILLPTMMGYQINVVLSNSMSPAVRKGSLVLSEVTEFEDVREGDVAVFQSSLDAGKRFTHRIVLIDVETESFTTKGDAVRTSDPLPVSYDKMIGRVRYVIPFAGIPYIPFIGFTGKAALLLLIILWISIEIELLRFSRKKRRGNK